MKDVLCIYYSRTGKTKQAMAEIAEALGLEMGTVKSRINRARGNVKKFLIERNLFT